MTDTLPLTAGTGSSIVVERCQVCDSAELDSVLFLGYIPPVNRLRSVGVRPGEEVAYPAELLRCRRCTLVQLGCIVDPGVLFPPDYPYTSGTTAQLHRNFEEMVVDCRATLAGVEPGRLVVDIGSNDGTLLSKWQEEGFAVHGIEPTDKAALANQRGIPTTQAFFDRRVALEVRERVGAPGVVAATNVFAHIEDVHAVVEAILALLDEDGVFISESHYLPALIETCQYDTIYHEHLRYYSLRSLVSLLEQHGLEVVHARRIPTHGGSLRAYAARRGRHAVRESVAALLEEERSAGLDGPDALRDFARRVSASKLELYGLLGRIRAEGGRVYAIGAPSRASTLIAYTALDDQMLECVLEVAGSHKIGRCMPGTLIPVEDERRLFDDPPDYALLLSWHIAEELIPKLRARGYTGRFIVPLPSPRVFD